MDEKQIITDGVTMSDAELVRAMALDVLSRRRMSRRSNDTKLPPFSATDTIIRLYGMMAMEKFSLDFLCQIVIFHL